MTIASARPPTTLTTLTASPSALLGLLAGIAAWGAAVGWAAHSGALARLAQGWMPAFAALVALGIALPTAGYFCWPSLRRAVDTIGLHRWTLMHAWRVPAALVFFYFGWQGALPPLFWLLAGVGDFIAGCYAATLFWGPRTPARYRRVHVFGFTDFIVAVGTGLTYTLLQDPRMAALTTLPLAWIPLFGVGLSGASHLIALTRWTRPAAL